MNIAHNFSATDWLALKLNQDLESDWIKAIDVFKDRLTERYIEPVDILIKTENHLPEKDRKFGFTVLAIDLLLMETIQSFKEGIINSTGKSKQIFTNFLKFSPYFNKYFSDDKSRENFYIDFRCGILHQAEIQSSALLWSLGEVYEKSEDLEIYNRNAIHENIKNDLNDYIQCLHNPKNQNERKLFKTKMNAIANRV